jgi:AcrR family transcriptional regulator
MDAALHVMRRNGFQGASVQDILDHAGLSTRAFYRQFRSKDDLLLAMFRTASDPDVAQVASAAEGAPTAIDAVRTWIDEMLAMAFDPRRVRRLVIFNSVARQADGYEEEEATLRSSLIAPLLGALQRGSSDGSFPATDPLPDADAIFDLVWSVAHPQRRSPTTDRARARDQVLRFCLPALGVDRSVGRVGAG